MCSRSQNTLCIIFGNEVVITMSLALRTGTGTSREEIAPVRETDCEITETGDEMTETDRNIII